MLAKASGRACIVAAAEGAGNSAADSLFRV